MAGVEPVVAIGILAANDDTIGDSRSLIGGFPRAGHDNAARGRRCGSIRARTYLRLPSIQSTVALTWSSVSAGLPPLGGMMPPSGPL